MARGAITRKKRREFAGGERGLIVGHHDGLRNLCAGKGDDNRTGGVEAGIIEQVDERDPDVGHHEEQRHRAAVQCDPHQLELLEVRLGLHRRAIAIQGYQHPRGNRSGQEQRKAREEVCEIVDAERAEREVLAQDQLVPLRDDETADRAEKDPFAEVDELVAGLGLPAEAVAVTRQGQVGESQLGDRGEHPADHEGPDRTRPPSQADHQDDAAELAGEVELNDASELQMPLRRFDACRKEAADEKGQAGDRQDLRKHRLRVEPGKGQGQGTGGEPQEHAADHVQRPGGVEEVRIVSAPAVRDRGARPHVGEVAEADHRDGDEGHHAEGFGEEHACQDEVGAEPDDLRSDESGDGPGRAAHGPREEALAADERRNRRHELLSRRAGVDGCTVAVSAAAFTFCLEQNSKRIADIADGTTEDEGRVSRQHLSKHVSQLHSP